MLQKFLKILNDPNETPQAPLKNPPKSQKIPKNRHQPPWYPQPRSKNPREIPKNPHFKFEFKSIAQ